MLLRLGSGFNLRMCSMLAAHLSTDNSRFKPLLTKPEPGPKRSSFIWLKDFFWHTVKGTKKSYYDLKFYISESKKRREAMRHHELNSTTGLDQPLDSYMALKTIRADAYKLVPYSVFIIVPFAELLIPVYLMLYQDAIPSRFITEFGYNSRWYKTSLVMEEHKKSLRAYILECLSNSVSNVPQEETSGVERLKNWVREGFDFRENNEKISESLRMFEKYIWPKILENTVALRDLQFSIGIGPLTGIHYINRLLKKFSISEVTLGSPIIKDLFKFYPKMRVLRGFRNIEDINKYLNQDSIAKQGRENLIKLALARGISPIERTEEEVRECLGYWAQMKSDKPTSSLVFTSICPFKSHRK